MRKTGAFFFAFLPFIIVTGIQSIASAFTTCTGLLTVFFSDSPIGDTFFALADDTDFNIILMLIYTFISIVFFGIWYYSRCGGHLRPAPALHFHPWNAVGILLLIPGASLFTDLMIGVISTILPQWLESYNDLMESSGMGESITLLTMVYAIILGPICEELIFRGVTLRLFERVFPFWFANFAQALLFGIFHGNWLQGSYAFVLGMLLGYICEKGGSIYYSLAAHMLFNIIGTYDSGILNAVSSLYFSDLLFLAAMILFLVFGFRFYNSGCRKLSDRQDRLQYLLRCSRRI